jgi:hypothetical protein
MRTILAHASAVPNADGIRIWLCLKGRGVPLAQKGENKWELCRDHERHAPLTAAWRIF